MIEPDEPAVTIFGVEVRPVARQNVGMEVDLHCRAAVSDAISFESAFHRNALQSSHRLWFFDFLAALFAGTARIVAPEIEHRLAEMLNDVRAVEMDVFHQ